MRYRPNRRIKFWNVYGRDCFSRLWPGGTIAAASGREALRTLKQSESWRPYRGYVVSLKPIIHQLYHPVLRKEDHHAPIGIPHHTSVNRGSHQADRGVS